MTEGVEYIDPYTAHRAIQEDFMRLVVKTGGAECEASELVQHRELLRAEIVRLGEAGVSFMTAPRPIPPMDVREPHDLKDVLAKWKKLGV